MQIRRVISLTMFLGFIAMVYTGIMLFLCPQGRVAYWTGWQLLGLSKEQYGQLHTTFMIVFMVAGIWHITLNWKSIRNYLRNRSRKLKIFTREFNVALVITVAFTVGTLAEVVPWSSLLAWEDSVKNYWEHRDGSPPWGHAEENTLARFIRGLVDWERLEHGRSVSLSVEDALTVLRSAGLTVTGQEQLMIDIAETNGTTPQFLMGILQAAEKSADPATEAVLPARAIDGPYPLPFSGLGRLTLRDYSQKYDLDLEELLDLFPADSTPDPDGTLREIADHLNTDPEGVIEMLNEEAGKASP